MKLWEMGFSSLFLLVSFSWVFFISTTHQLQIYETQLLLQLRKHLEYPTQLQSWENYNADMCDMPSTLHMSIKCLNNSVSELKIMGDKLAKVSQYHGFAVPNHTLSSSFSIDSFVTTLARLSNLRFLSLVSLGIWGELPDKIHRLYSLEVLDMSSNFMFGAIPPAISRLVNLHTLTLDGNFFNGSFPDWLDSLSNLSALSIKNNNLKGPVPNSISRIKKLTGIALSHNQISGKLPDLSSLTNLRLLDMRENRLDSQLPLLPGSLTTVLLSKNRLSGNIQEQFGKLNQLQHLDLSFNSLSGTPPTTLFSLSNISYLNLASNLLTGSLPDRLSCGEELGYVDISSNRFTGSLPSCLASTSEKRIVTFAGNCLSINNQHQNPESYCASSIVKEQSSKKEIGVYVGVVGGTVIVVILVLSFLVLSRRYTLREAIVQHTLPKIMQCDTPSGISSEVLANARIISQAAKLGTQGTQVQRVFSLEELKEATDNFSQLLILGEGYTGKLYKGRLENGTYIAIRSLPLFRNYLIRNLEIRLNLLSKLRHPHLVELMGYSIDREGHDILTASRVFLVYEYVPNGNFRSHLSETSPDKALKWSDRLAILIGVAKAVHFLHTGVNFASFYNRLKTNNILIDEHFVAKLSDYGVSIITEDIDKLEAKGDGPKSWHKTTKLDDDVYSFGFILLESLVGPIASFGSQDGRKRLVDPLVLTTCSEESLKIVVSITNKCISLDSSRRPSFEDVLWNLQYAAQVQAIADADQKSSASSQ
nr:PREDICTED: probable inactive leucine-rich repeat receptor-like protein kinase At3g03770 isoform X2 [Daucus carota subsp. sativus]